MKFRLKSAHFIEGDKWLPGDKENEHLGDDKGTIVGDGTPHQIKSPTLEMVPLDEEAEKALDAEMERLARNSASMNPVDQLPVRGDDYDERYVPGFPGTKRPSKAA